MATVAGSKIGALTIAGSGIASVGHITLETLSYIREAEKIFYAVTDPVTESFIQDNSKGDHFDLRVFYDNAKKRYETYVQMCEVMLKAVREGYSVLGIFYGHPGVFVSPSHRAIAIARSEGYEAKMLPGISAEDYLYADLEFDPGVGGCMTQEATDLLVKRRTLDPTVHNIIWQVGSVGVDDMVFDNAKFHILVDRIEADFGPNHRVVHYIGAILPQSATVKDQFYVADLRREEVAKQFTTTSTLYIPPRDIVPANKDAVQELGLPESTIVTHLSAGTRWADVQVASINAYGTYERDAIAKIDTHRPPDHYEVIHCSSAMRKFMADLVLRPSLLREYRINPLTIAGAAEGITDEEKLALGLGKPGPIFAVMRASPADVAAGRRTARDEIVAAVPPAAFPGIMTIIITL